jgi:divalent metal cation (Fe/Co/Zn/Cd) transporter
MTETEQMVLVTAASCPADCGCAAPASRLATADPRLRRWAWWLAALTIGWNSLEAVIAIMSGLLAGSIALVGFGLDSVVEVGSALVIIWRLTYQGKDQEATERAEQRAVRLIALTFGTIAAYVTYDAVRKLLGIGEEPHQSTAGLIITALSVVVMPAIAWAKRRVASGLGSVALKADAAETQLCTYLSAVVLIGLGANSLFAWWWMDPIAGLVVAGLALKEGWAAWTSGDLCEC